MNRKQFIILLLVVALVGTAGWIVHQRNQASWQSSGQEMGQKLLPDFPVNNITQIEIQSGTNELTLARPGDVWCVQQRNNYPANFSQISDLLIKLGDLKIAQSQEVGPSQLGRFNLLPPGTDTNTGTLMQFKDQSGKVLASLLLGKKHMKQPAGNQPPGGMGDESWPDGRYVMAGTDSKTLALVSDPLDTVEAKPASWLKKDFIGIENPTMVAVDFPEATNSWKLTQEGGTNGWVLADLKAGEKLDSSKVSGVTSGYGSFSFDDVMAGDTKLEISGLTNVTTLTVKTKDDFTYVLKIGRQLEDEYPLSVTVTADFPTTRTPGADEKPADKAKLDKDFADHLKTLQDKLAKEKQLADWVFKVPSYSLSSFLKPRAQLMEEPPKPAESDKEDSK